MLKLQKQLKVIKRDGQIVPFDEKKIENAIRLSAERTRKTLSENFCNDIIFF